MVYVKATLAGLGSVMLIIIASIVLMMSKTRTSGLGAVFGYTIGNIWFWLACLSAFILGFWLTARTTPTATP
jgi:hypothetical protein